MNDLTIGQGVEVTMHFSLTLDDGTLVDSNFDSKPATFDIGDGNLLAGFEEVLFGLKAGDEREFVIPPEKGFGQHNPSNVQTVSRDEFPDDITLEEGLVLSFADAQQTELPGVVTAFDDTTVTVDFNHPLAGRSIAFAVKIVDVKPTITH